MKAQIPNQMTNQAPKKSILKISNMNDSLIGDLTNIAKNMGLTRGGFIKMELKKVRDSYPENYRMPPSK